MKRFITSILLAAVILTMNAQVKTSMNTCLQSNETGEWLIGLFENFALYDAQYWHYESAGKGKFVLANGNKRVNVLLKGNSLTIDGKKHRCKELTSQFVNNYPHKDTSVFANDVAEKADSITVRVVLRSGSKGKEVSIYPSTFFDTGSRRVINTDSRGIAEVSIPIVATTGIDVTLEPGLRFHRAWIELIASPSASKDVLLYIDEVNKRIYVMGENARLSNELLSHSIGAERGYFSSDKQISVADYQIQGGAFRNRQLAKLDSVLQANPTLSDKFRTYCTENIRYEYAYGLTQMSNKHKVKAMIPAIAELREKGYLHPLLPLTLVDKAKRMFKDYASLIGMQNDLTSWEISNKVVEGMKLTARQEKILADANRLMSELETMAKTHSGKELTNHYIKNKPVIDSLNALIETPEIQQRYKSLDIRLLKLQKLAKAIDADSIAPFAKQMMKVHTVLSMFENSSEPLSQAVTDFLKKQVTLPHLYSVIEAKNNEISAYSLQASTVVTADPRPLAKLTDGKAIFDAITAPYRGKIIYVDVWGTWCAPCREEMKQVPQMKKTLQGKDIVYLYLCNRSSDESWKTSIAKYNLTGDNVVHYNLPEKQQSAVEDYLGVKSYPTYKLVNRDGQLLPASAPRPSMAERLKAEVEKLEQEQ